MYKVKYKLLLYRETRWPVSTLKMGKKNTPGRATFQAKIQVDDLHFYIKI